MAILIYNNLEKNLLNNNKIKIINVKTKVDINKKSNKKSRYRNFF